VEKSLQKNPGDRYRSMREMVTDLRALARASGVEEPAPAMAPRTGGLALRYSAGAVALLAVAGGGWYAFTSKGPVTIPSEFVQLTNFSDYANAPALSRDGSMVAFFRGGTYFNGRGQVYVKILSSGESKQLTDDSTRKYNAVFTPDGSRVAYSSQSASARTWDTWTVPVLGGPPSRFMQNATGLSWFTPDRIVFSEIMMGTAIHMGIVTARDNRAEERELYFPAHERAMAHYSYPSPDQRSLLVVEMDAATIWQRCRLMPMDGSSIGKQVGPEGACTAAGWSPDGKWMYFTAQVGGSSHIWRQRFPEAPAQQITFGPTEEEGLAIAPDGKSLIASVGTRQSSVWLHDADGDHRLEVEGSASQPVFSADGRRLYYLVKKGNAESTELWVRDLMSGKVDPVITGQNIMDYGVSPDQRNVVFTARRAGASEIFLAAEDRGSAPRLLAKNGDSASFAGPSAVVFRQLDDKANYLARVHIDGTGLERIVNTPIVAKIGTSPDGEWAVASGLTDQWDRPGTYATSLRDGSRRPLCAGHCGVRWSGDGKSLFLALASAALDRGNAQSLAGRTLVLPLARGLVGVSIPAGGFTQAREEEFAGIPLIRQEEVSPGFDAKTYAYTTAEFQGNLFRIPLH
jgi:eukaryotic-like serine/threonine-protein kinase